MTIDINLLREEKGGKPDTVRDSEKRRMRDTATVDKLIAADQQWRKSLFAAEQARKDINAVNKDIAACKKKDPKDPCEELKNKANALKTELPRAEDAASESAKTRDALLHSIGNLVHPDVPVSADEANNKVIRTWGTPRRITIDGTPGAMHHHEILSRLEGIIFKKGAEVAGHRGYYLKGPGMMLNQALIQFGLSFLMRKGHTPIQPPYFMRREVMSAAAELKDFSETLYCIPHEREAVVAVTAANAQAESTGAAAGGQQQQRIQDTTKDDLFLIATSEQPLCALHRGEALEERELPIRYAGMSTCFRKEAGSHGKDCWGIFRVHQFEKIEQFVLSTPETSWAMHEEMIRVAEEFYQKLDLPYRVVSIVSGALNDAAAKKYDLEAWFPGYGDFRELVSCSNCTDFQSRDLDIRLGQKGVEGEKKFVHLLNATLVASQRCLCCILENYQTPQGVNVPRALVPFMGGMEFLRFTAETENVKRND